MTKVKYTVQDILNLPMQENDASADTIGDYLQELLSSLWEEGDGFSGKRPFGNSNWESELYHTLVMHEIIQGEIIDGYLESYDEKKGYKIIKEAIQRMYMPE
jgi:hypothetical protein